MMWRDEDVEGGGWGGVRMWRDEDGRDEDEGEGVEE